jgi:hypothetical protein
MVLLAGKGISVVEVTVRWRGRSASQQADRISAERPGHEAVEIGGVKIQIQCVRITATIIADGAGPASQSSANFRPDAVGRGLVARHRGFDRLIFGHFRMGKSFGATSSSMLRGTPG